MLKSIAIYPLASAFSAINNANQAITGGAWTKVALPVEQFDTNGFFDNATNYRFQPTVPGVYQIDAQIKFGSTNYFTTAISVIAKNGAFDGRYDSRVDNVNGLGGSLFLNGSRLIYMNGTTDYVELYAYCLGAGTLTVSEGSGSTSYLQGFYVRSV